jgi:hypothetical protein
MIDWQEEHSTWKAAIHNQLGSWSFTKQNLTEAADQLDQVLAYPEEEVAHWLSTVCSGLPQGSPDPDLTSIEFVRSVQQEIRRIVASWPNNRLRYSR